MKTIYVTKKIVDVFCGDGWEGWTRFELVRKGDKLFFHKLKGNNLIASDMYKLRQMVK